MSKSLPFPPDSEFITVEGVPILDEHIIKDKEGRTLARIDADRLKHIAKINNSRMEETGDFIPIIVGHTKGEVGEYVPEEEQPEIVGFMTRMKVGKFLNTTRKAILACCKFFKSKRDKVNKHPRRSVELWLSDWKIDPLSLLGATSPERDLGLLQLSSSGKKVLRRVITSPIKFSKEVKSMDTEAIVQAVLKAFEQSDLGQFLVKLKDEVEGGGEGEGQEGEPAEGLGPEGPEEPPMPDAEGEEGEDLGEEGPERYSSVASGGNTYTNSFGAGKVSKKKNYSREAGQERVRMSRLEKAVHGLQTVNDDLRVRLQRAEREKDLLFIQSHEGLDFDINEELDWLSQLPDNQYEAHLTRIRKRYAKAPIGETLDLQHTRIGSPIAGQSGRSKDQAMAVAALASKKGISYMDALTELEGQ